MQDCNIALPVGNLVRDAISQSIDNIANLEKCNADKRQLREYYEVQGD